MLVHLYKVQWVFTLHLKRLYLFFWSINYITINNIPLAAFSVSENDLGLERQILTDIMDYIDNLIKKAEYIKFLQNKIKTYQAEIIDYSNKLLPM